MILVQGFCPLKIKITQFPGGFRLASIFERYCKKKNTTTLKEQVLGLKFDEWNNIQIRTSSACQNWTGSYGKNVGMKLTKQWLLSKCEC